MFKSLKIYFFIAITCSFLTACFSGSSDSSSTSTPANSMSGSLSLSIQQLIITPTQSLPITLTNTGNATLTDLNITLSPQISGHIVLGTCTTELAAHASCQVNIQAGDHIAINQSGLFTVGAAGLAPISIPAQVIVPILTLSSTDIDNYGDFVVTLTNNNPIDATVNSLNVQPTSGAGINAGNNNCSTLSKNGGSCQLHINVLNNANGQAQLTIHGTYPEVNTDFTMNANLTINDVSVVAKNSLGTNVANILINPNSSQTITITNNGNFPIQNFNIHTPSLGNVTVMPSPGCGNLLAHSSCSINFTAGANPTGIGTLAISGDNIAAGTINIPVNTLSPGQDIAFTPIDRFAQPANLRGLKYAEVQVSNQSSYPVSLTSINSNLSNVILATDSLHAPSSGCELNGTLPSLGSCTFWVSASNNDDVGSQTGTLQINYNLNGSPNTEALNLNVESDLYMFGSFATATNTCYNGATATTCQNLAKWNGSQWQVVGGQPIIGNSFDNVHSLTVDQNGNIDFITTAQPYNSTSNTLINHLASWDGVSWGNFNGGLTSNPNISGSIYQALAWNNSNPNNPILYFAYDNNFNYALGTWSATNGITPFAYNAGSQQIYAIAYDPSGNKVYLGSMGTDPNVFYSGAADLSNINGINGFSSTLGQTGEILIDGNNLYLGGYFISDADSNTYLLDTYNSSNNNITSTNIYNPADMSPTALQGNLFIQKINNGNLYFTSDYNANKISCGIFSAPKSDPNDATLIASNTEYGGCFYRPDALIITHDNSYYAVGNFPEMTPANSATVNSNCIVKKNAAGTWSPLSTTIGFSNNIADSCGIGSTFQASILMAPTLTISN